VTLSQIWHRHSLWADSALLGAVALGLRVWSIGFDLPNLYHRDEAKYVSIPLRILKTGDYNPHFFNYPTLFFYLLALVYIVYFLFMASRGALGSLDGLVMPEIVMENVVGRATMPSQFLIGRGFVALTGALTVVLVYWLARTAFNRRIGWLAAILFSVSPTHIRNSHFIAPDVTMILFLVASFACTYQVWREGRRRDYVLAGLLAGLAISTKYNAYPILVPLILAHGLRKQGQPLLNSDILLALLASAGGFLIGTPYAFLDLPAFLNDVAFEMRHYGTMGDPGTEGQNALLWYARYLMRSEGLVPLLAGWEGLSSLVARRAKTLLFIAFPAVYMLLVSFYAVKNDRTILAIVPFLAVLAAAVLDRVVTALSTYARTRQGALAVRGIAAFAVLLSIAWPAWQAVRIDLRFTDDDVRTEVTQWMESELPRGSRIVGEYYSPLLIDSHHQFQWVDRAIDLPLLWYQENADYLVLVENRYGGFYLDPSRYAAEIAAYASFSEQFSLVEEFQGGALGNPCHAIVYKVRP
jgi:4-amino-4-deoxy-L-arabinose transferase-like glycosyltransferase